MAIDERKVAPKVIDGDPLHGAFSPFAVKRGYPVAESGYKVADDMGGGMGYTKQIGVEVLLARFPADLT